MKILLIGASGQIGAELAVLLRDMGTLVAASRAQMDLLDSDQIRDAIRAVQPELIVNAAAYTDVERAESEAALAHCINGEAPAVMAQEAQRLGIALIHYSTDYVFDGLQSIPYDEAARPNPLNAYGRSKLAGEHGIARYCDKYWILRCSRIYSTQRTNFLTTIWRLAQERDELQVVNDQIGAPTWSRTIASTTRGMLAKAVTREESPLEHIRKTSGLYHLAAAGAVSWHTVAQHILHRMQEADIPLTLAQEALMPIPTSNYPSAAQRPLHSCLQTTKLRDIFQLSFPDWQVDFDTCIRELISARNAPGQ